MSPLENIKVCVFDAYGTLFDLASAVAPATAELGDRAEPLSRLWRQKQLEYTWLRTLMGRHADFDRVTKEALDYCLDALSIDDPGIRSKLMSAYDTLDAYPEVPDVLRAYRAKGLPCAILSNGMPEQLAKGVENAGLSALLDDVLSVEQVGAFKPSGQVYRLAAERFGVQPMEVAFHSSNAWDICGASSFGFQCIWVNRGGAPLERLPGGPAAILSDLRGAPDIVQTA